jgi:hypothetical protein
MPRAFAVPDFNGRHAERSLICGKKLLRIPCSFF